jgi:hypothetical protein
MRYAMLHIFPSNITRRVYNLKTCTAKEMLEDLTHTKTWTLCTGWKVGDTLYLNDSTSEDGAQEYAVLRVRSEDGRLSAQQFESVTFGWMELDEIKDFIDQTWNADIETGDYAEIVKYFDGIIFVQDHHDTLPHCSLCA